MFLGAVFGFFVAIKGYSETRERGINRFQVSAFFNHSDPSPTLRRLVRIWTLIMMAGIALTAIGIARGLIGKGDTDDRPAVVK